MFVSLCLCINFAFTTQPPEDFSVPVYRCNSFLVSSYCLKLLYKDIGKLVFPVLVMFSWIFFYDLWLWSEVFLKFSQYEFLAVQLLDRLVGVFKIVITQMPSMSLYQTTLLPSVWKICLCTFLTTSSYGIFLVFENQIVKEMVFHLFTLIEIQ